ncbi:sodium/proline symporter PutP [Alkalibaculum sporogenes]
MVNIVFIFYLIGMLLVGIYFYKKNESMSDYVIGDRKLNPLVTSLSAQASDMSGWLLLGLPGLAYASTNGMVEAVWTALGLAIGTYLNWRFVAKRLRNYTFISGDSITLPEYFENRFRDTSKLLRLISAFLILLFFLFYTASGFVAGAKLFNTVFGFNYTLALIVGVLVIISYTFLGGFMAVSWTDMFQGLLMLIAVVVTPIVALSAAGQVDGLINTAYIDFQNIFTFSTGEPISFLIIFSWFAWGFGYFGQPHILARFMAIRSAKEVKPARIIAMIWVVISLAAAVIVGIVGRVYLNTPLDEGASETIFMVLVSDLFPAVIAGVLLSAILAAIMSTADSQLLVTSSAITGDFYRTVYKKDASQKELLWVSRGAVILIALIAGILALDENSSVFRLVSYAWAGFGSAFGPVILLSLYWKRMTRNGALWGMIAGGITVVVWKNLSGGIFDLYEIVPGMILSLVVIVVCSLLDKEPSIEIQEEFDKVNKINLQN